MWLIQGAGHNDWPRGLGPYVVERGDGFHKTGDVTSMKIIAIVGTYRKGGVIDTAVDEILASAREADAEVSKVYLIDRHIEFCTNCRSCTQEPGWFAREVRHRR